MKIRFNHVMVSAIVAIVFVVTSAIAKNVSQNPVPKSHSSPAKHSARRSFHKLNFPVSHIVQAPEKSTTVTNAKNILDTSTESATTVASTSVNTIGTTTIKEFVPANNIRATFPVKRRANNATATTSIEGTADAQAEIIANVEKVTENQTDKNQILIKKQTYTNLKSIIRPVSRKCRQGYIITSTGDCKPRVLYK